MNEIKNLDTMEKSVQTVIKVAALMHKIKETKTTIEMNQNAQRYAVQELENLLGVKIDVSNVSTWGMHAGFLQKFAEEMLEEVTSIAVKES